MATGLPVYPDSDFSDEEVTPLDITFNKAADHLNKIANKLDNNQLLELYGLYKQGIEGKCITPKPGWFDGRGRKKWEAWNALRDLPKEAAKERYIALIQKYDPHSELGSPSSVSPGPKEAWVAVSSLQRPPEPELDHENLSILEAAREDLGTVVTEMLAENPDLKDEKDDDGLTALHWAADRDSTKALLAAIKGGCPVDAVDDAGQTALHYAASCGHINSTKILVDAGASLLKDEEGNTPLDLATDEDIQKILEGATK
ncbi:hypothetical protein O0L34_g8045 [Tuta absoluta]|nr:hypothetical protein O0L34_g8045 [Tuta absoluta]